MTGSRSPIHTLAALICLTLAGCHSSPSIRTQTLRGRFVMATAHRIQVQIEQPGTLTNLLVMPLDPKAKVTIAGRAESLEKMPMNAKVRLTRDIDTHRVIRIDAD